MTLPEIHAYVCARYGVTMPVLLSPLRAARIVRARQEGMWLARRYTGMSLPAIARAFGRKDHSTVLWAIRQHSKRISYSMVLP